MSEIILSESQELSEETQGFTPEKYKKIIIEEVIEIKPYPDEFNEFCRKNDLQPPKHSSGNGKALSAMLNHPYCYWDRQSCDQFCSKFGIETKDSIQLFNKHSQWGIKTNSGSERGRLYIVYPYEISNKHKMRKDFKFDGTIEQKNAEIQKIKSTIAFDYVDVPNEQWQLGHKNPGLTDNSNCNLVLQPPIQAKYKDDYVFFDTLTKMPLSKKLKHLIESGEVTFSQEQLQDYIKLFQSMLNVVS